MAAKLKPDDKDDRPWYLLALHRAEQLEKAIHDRRQFVETQLRLADEAEPQRTAQPGDHDPQQAGGPVRGLYRPGRPLPRDRGTARDHARAAGRGAAGRTVAIAIGSAARWARPGDAGTIVGHSRCTGRTRPPAPIGRRRGRVAGEGT